MSLSAATSLHFHFTFVADDVQRPRIVEAQTFNSTPAILRRLLLQAQAQKSHLDKPRAVVHSFHLSPSVPSFLSMSGHVISCCHSLMHSFNPSLTHSLTHSFLHFLHFILFIDFIQSFLFLSFFLSTHFCHAFESFIIPFLPFHSFIHSFLHSLAMLKHACQFTSFISSAAFHVIPYCPVWHCIPFHSEIRPSIQ